MNVPGPDPYTLLGVTSEATDDDLDHAFRGLVRRLHPDTRTSSESDADRRLQELLSAYATLRDPIRRAAYDSAQIRPVTTNRAPTPQTRPAEPAIRVGPVRWQPSRRTSTGGTDRHGH
jgi:curved DNA-binding protein CbpA